jgi:hypothetical protein
MLAIFDLSELISDFLILLKNTSNPVGYVVASVDIKVLVDYTAVSL